MFTGIIEEVGTVQKKSANGMTIQAGLVLEGTKPGDSIAINGVCLTATSIQPPLHPGETGAFSMDIVPETWRRTDLGDLCVGDLVNLERPLTPTARMGGHFVQGHVDGTGSIMTMVQEGEAINIRFQAPPILAKYLVEKGFIAVDGISLTVVETGLDFFSVTLIPFTQEHTNFREKRLGMAVNLEVDILSKYVERFLKRDEDAEAPAPIRADLREVHFPEMARPGIRQVGGQS